MRTALQTFGVTLPAVLLVSVGPLARPAERTVEIQVGDHMKFSPAAIDAKAGESIRVVLKHVGTMPKAAMGHNFVLLKKGVNPKAYVDKAASARDTDFVPPALKDQVIAATRLIGPGETSEASFTAAATGEYDFICTFPGHFALGMRGKMRVQ